MPHTTCTLDDCSAKHYGRGYCARHYTRLRRYGDPRAGGGDRATTPAESFASNTEQQGEHLIWTGDLQSRGYGRISVGGRYQLAHRYAYTIAFGEIPEGMHVDHRCHVRTCVRPEHLRLVTPKQNQEHRTRADRGVSWDGRKWVAYITHNRERTYLGRFDDRRDAVAAAAAKRIELFTHNDFDRVV